MKTLEDFLTKAQDIMRLRHYSLRTEECYCHWISRYWAFLKERKIAGPAERRMEAFLTHLARDREVAASTQNQAFAAVRFLYEEVMQAPLGKIDGLRARKAAYVRTAPSRAEVARLLAACTDVHGYPTRLLAHLLYERGMRVLEPLRLRRKDVDLPRGRLTLYQTKGDKSRVVRLPEFLIEPLRRQLVVARAHFEANLARQGPPVKLPHAQERKAPSLGWAWQWWWVFPSRTPCRDKRTGQTVWWHQHEANIQRCVRAAAVKCGLEGWITPHVLRHACATHLIEAGVPVPAVQLLLGHADIHTTQGYCHLDALSVPCPAEITARLIPATITRLPVERPALLAAS